MLENKGETILDIRNNNIYEEPEQTKGKNFWKHFGIFALALFLSVLTILVIYVG